MLTRRSHAGSGTIRSFDAHRILHGTATLLVNNGMPLEDVNRLVCLTRLGRSTVVSARERT